MNGILREVKFVGQINPSALTVRLKDGFTHVPVRAWTTTSQPARMLMLSLIIMSSLCGWLYYGTAR